MKNKKGEKTGKKIMTIFGILILLVFCYFALNKYEEAFMAGENKSSVDSSVSNVQTQTENIPSEQTATSTSEPDYENNTEIVPEVVEEVIVTPYSLTEEQMNIIEQTISSSGFLEAFPKNGIIGLNFYDFASNGERVWSGIILIGKSGLLTSGSPDLTLMISAKYISQLNGTNLCEVLTGANANGEMWAESDKSEASLIWKYSGMMKYKDCLGF